MTHARQQIRTAAVALATGLATTGSRVYDSRFFELEPDTQLPCWAVYTTDEVEDAEFGAMGGMQDRVCRLSFAGLARALTGAALQSTLDTMCEELETVVRREAIAGCECVYLRTEWEFGEQESEAAEGRVTVSFAVRYYTNQGAPGVLI